MAPMESAVYAEIEELLAAGSSDERSPSRERLEHALTTGYAAALQLDAGRARLERRIGELARNLAGGDGGEWAELTRLAQEKAAVEREAARLRALLDRLSARVREARAS